MHVVEASRSFQELLKSKSKSPIFRESADYIGKNNQKLRLSLTAFDEANYTRFKHAKASRFLPERGCFAENGVMVLLLSLWMWRDGSVSIPRIVKQALDGCLDAEDCC